MKHFNFVYIFYPFPLVFFVLTGSANLSGPRIGQTLGTVVVLFLCLAYLHFRDNHVRGRNRMFLDLLVAIIIAVSAIIGKNINLAFSLMVFLWPISAYFNPEPGKLRLTSRVVQATLLFCLIYFGINEYNFENLLNSKVTGMIVVFVLQYLFIAAQFSWNSNKSMSREIGMSFVLAILGLALYSAVAFEPKYLIALAVVSAPSFLSLFRLVNIEDSQRQKRFIGWLRLLSITGLTLFNLYLFLDTTQVHQAVMGGY